MNTKDAFVAEIIANTADNAVRLIFADWLEEHGGQPERGEFIRVQVELSTIQPAGEPSTGSTPVKDRYRDLRRRVRELLKEFAKSGHPGGKWYPEVFWQAIGSPGGGNVIWHRGFIAKVFCTLSSWLTHGRELARSQPVEFVRLHDKSPSGSYHEPTTLWTWTEGPQGGDEGNKSFLPHLLWERLPSPHVWHSWEAASDALSDVCLQWARSLSDLPR